MPRKNRAATLAEVLAFGATAPPEQIDVTIEALRTINVIRRATDGRPAPAHAVAAVAAVLAPKVVPPRKRTAPKPPPLVETPSEVGE